MTHFRPFTINIQGRLVCIDKPQVMGIVNITPDSFYERSRVVHADDITGRVAAMVADGADMLDIGAYSSRPGASEVSAEEEIARLRHGVRLVREAAPEVPLSVDTFRASVARVAVEELGVDIVNDISGGNLDSEMLPEVARMKVPYILMHMRGTPAKMQSLCQYDEGVTVGVVRELSASVERARKLGINDIIVDPGFGFSKTLDQNYRMLHDLSHIVHVFGLPVLVGVSRKSMITRLLDITPQQALNGTTVVNTLALAAGASILRVHDVRAAREAVDIYSHTHMCL